MKRRQEPDYLGMSEEQIDLIIGESLLKERLGSKPASEAEIRMAAQNWFRLNVRRLSQAICNDKSVANFLLGPQREDRNVLFASVVDVLVRMLGGTVPVGALAAKILHYGVKQLCGKSSEPKT